MALRETNLDGILPLLAKGKVRDIYEVDEKTLLFVATDRISAYDVIMDNTIPDKGVLLTKLAFGILVFFLGQRCPQPSGRHTRRKGCIRPLTTTAFRAKV